MKLKSQYPSFVGLALIALAFMIEIAGCKFDQAKATAVVERIGVWAQATSTALPAAASILDDLQITEPQIAESLRPIAAQAKPALDKLIAACGDYAQHPAPDLYQTVLNATDLIAGQVDRAALLAVQIKDQQSQRRATAWIGTIATGLHVLYAVLQGYASSGQLQAIPKTAPISFERIRPLLDREYARLLLDGMGYNADAAMKAAGF